MARRVKPTRDPALPRCTDEDIENIDDLPDGELERLEEEVVDQASAASTIAELEAEIATLGLEDRLAQVRCIGHRPKWEELSDLLQNQPEMFDARGHRGGS